MIPERLRFRGISTAFPDEVDIDFTTLPSGLIAICGENESGKTHVLGLAGFATLFRTFPGYRKDPRFVAHATARDAFSELTFRVGDHRYVCRVQADPQHGGGRGKTEAYLSRDGEPVAGPVLDEVDAELAKILPPSDFWLASVVAAQTSVYKGPRGNGGFFALDKADRKDLVIAMLRLAFLQVLAKRADARATTALADLARLRAQVAPIEARVARVIALEGLLDEATERRAAAQAALDASMVRVGEAVSAVTAAREHCAVVAAEAARRTEERTRRLAAEDDAATQVQTLTTKRAALARTLGAADEIRAAAAALVAMDEAAVERDAWERAIRTVQTPIVEAVATHTARRTQLLEMAARLRDAEDRARTAETRIAERRTLEADAERHQSMSRRATAEIAAYDAALPDAEADAERERAALAHRAELVRRVADLTPRQTLLAEIPGVDVCGRCPLTEDARAAAATLATIEAELRELPVIPTDVEGMTTAGSVTGSPCVVSLAIHRANRQDAVTRRDAADQWLAEHATALAELAEDRQTLAGASLAEVTAELERVIADGQATRASLDAAVAEQRTYADALDTCAAEAEALRTRRAKLAPLAARLPEIAVAEAQHAEADTALAAAQTALEAATAARRALATADAAPAGIALAAALTAQATVDAEAAAARETQTAADREVARLDGERAGLGDPGGELARVQARIAETETEAADWARLARELGRDGIQALALDAAGPRVTALANALLTIPFGGRFQLDLATTVETKKGTQKEVFDIRILDAERPRDDALEGCGGEMTVLDEAVRLALALRNAEESALAVRTLYRDESGAALSGTNAADHLAMLRQALVVGGYDRCFFISHNRDLWAQADACLLVKDGRVVQVPPEDAARLLAAAPAAEAA